ncbi:MAG: trimeric intracellular cation channel family protein [Neisseria sp.]|nr:trimeric intracellular cation channel family protein [Neisseria sp.]
MNESVEIFNWTLSKAQIVIEVLAIMAFALSGLIEAARHKLDAVGVFVAAGLTAFGGGTLRDLLIDRRPFFWVEHYYWLWVLLLVGLAAMAFMRSHTLELTEKAMQWPDALGLGLFAASGTQLALVAEMPALVAVLMGMMSAVTGGVLRDIVVNEIPRAFSDYRPYAVCAFLGGWVVVLGEAVGLNSTVTLVTAAGVTIALRGAALLTDYRLPEWRKERENR